MTVAEKKLLDEGLRALNIDLSRLQQQQLFSFLQFIQHWNKTHNLTAIENLADMIIKHLFDSLSILKYITGENILDVGCGAGLPGIPLAIADPRRAYHLLDANQKRIAFVKQVKRALKLENVFIYHSRVENFSAEKFSCITSRAFSSLSTFIQATELLLDEGGCWLAMKGSYPVEEIQSLPESVVLQETHRLLVPKLEADRHLLCIRRRF